MDFLFGSGLPLAARFFIAFLVVLALIGLTAWLVRRFGANRLGGTVRGRQPRLAVIDAASVDGRRRLVLIRRDNTEHLLMIGGPTDVVVETNILRAGARETTREPARVSMSAETTARLTPEAAWPQAPAPEPPPPPPPARSYRSSATEEPWLPPEPGARARPAAAADSLTGLAAELSSKLGAHDFAPPPARSEPTPRSTAAPPMAPLEPAAAPQNDRNLAEMAQQLEAALRRTPAPESRPPVTDPLAVPPAAAAKTPRAPARDVKPRQEPKLEPKFDGKREPKLEARIDTKPEPKFDPKFESRPEPKFEFRPDAPAATGAPGRNFYDNLEEEMASLLGRPPDKP
jgi:flagellar protein FliO/FliZ